jgi:hypothetical protein
MSERRIFVKCNSIAPIICLDTSKALSDHISCRNRERLPYLKGALRVFSLPLDEKGQYRYTSKRYLHGDSHWPHKLTLPIIIIAIVA